jgi:hypothetical protein
MRRKKAVSMQSIALAPSSGAIKRRRQGERPSPGRMK